MPATSARRATDLIVSSLQAIFGPRITLNADILRRHGQSETHHQGYLPDCVVMAHTTEEVAEVVGLCGEHRIPVIPFGAGTSVEGNFAPVHGGVCLDLSEMNAVVSVNPEDADCTVQAGVRRNHLNEHLRDKGLFFPIDPGADATIGGMAATRASGTNAVRYGTMKDAVVSLRVVMPDGTDVRTAGRARKSAAGYDLTRMFVGSEGTLGVITEVTLRLHPIPQFMSSAVCGFETLDGAVNAVVQTIQLGVPIARVEILDDVQMRAVNRWSKLNYPEVTTLFFEFHGSERYVREQIESVAEIAAENGGGDFRWATTTEERSKLWKARHQAFYAAVGLRPGAMGWPTDVCVPISRLADCIRQTKADLEKASIPAPILGHVGDGNFHVIFVIDPNNRAEMEEAQRLNAALIDRALAMGGTCTGEHGVGLGKIDYLERELPQAIDLMRTLKRAFDPLNIMNPGKVVRV